MASYNRHSKVTVEDLEQIRLLAAKGLSARDIMRFVPLADSAISRYAKILDAVHEGREIQIGRRQYSEDAVREYCEAHGLQYNPAQVQLALDDADLTAGDCLQGIKAAFEQFAQAAEAFAAQVRGWNVGGQHHAD